ncbi:hypothetical protein CC79DRAFT_638155 [Sarocladium strictum]
MESSFPRLSELPAEIRLQIWTSALPAHDKPSLFPWRLRCWGLQPVPPSDPSYDPAAPGFPRMEFNHNLLTPLRCNALSISPLLWVSGEAREVALAWVKRNGFEETENKGGYTRKFNPEIDVVFLPWLIKDEDSTRNLDTRSILYNELFDRLQDEEALTVVRREVERRKLLRGSQQPPYQQQNAAADGGNLSDDDDFDEADYRKIEPWSAISRFALPARRGRGEGEWTLLPHFFPKFDTLYILAPKYGDANDITNSTSGEDMKFRRRYDLDPERSTSYMEFDGKDQFVWRGDWERDESLLVSGGQAPEYLGNFRGDMYEKKNIVDALLVMNIEDSAKDLGSAVRNTHDKRPFRFRPVPSWWIEE